MFDLENTKYEVHYTNLFKKQYKKILKQAKKTGYFLFGNHTNNLLVAFVRLFVLPHWWHAEILWPGIDSQLQLQSTPHGCSSTDPLTCWTSKDWTHTSAVTQAIAVRFLTLWAPRELYLFELSFSPDTQE